MCSIENSDTVHLIKKCNLKKIVKCMWKEAWGFFLAGVVYIELRFAWIRYVFFIFRSIETQDMQHKKMLLVVWIRHSSLSGVKWLELKGMLSNIGLSRPGKESLSFASCNIEV